MHSNTRRGLTQLYNDAKISYENVTSSQRSAAANSPYDNDPEVLALRKEFQVQQDRLLAWGIHWADKQAVGSSASGKSKEAGFDVDIDDKVDQAGLGEVVASIMESIRSTLAESGQLQHPERWREGRGPPLPAGAGGMWGAMRSGMMKEKMGPASPKTERKEWKEYELTTGNELLQKLKDSIDLLYALDSSQPDDITSSKKAKETTLPSSILPASPPVSMPRHMSIEEAFNTTEPNEAALQLISHPLYIDFSRLEPMHDPNAAEEPPSYEEAKDNTTPVQPKSVYYFPGMQTHVLVDLTRARNLPPITASMTETDPFRKAHELSQIVSGNGLLTWDGHLKLLGFTLTDANLRFGLVYALPAPNDPTALQACQTLTTTIAATLENETSFPPLENKFRLAYNIALSATSYLAHGECHGHIKSSNIIFLRENDNPRLGKTLRDPYLLQPVQKFAGEASINPPLSATIYHHSDADETGYGLVPAYDIFSIGLVLLEIGLWRPLTTFWKQKYDRALFHERLRKYYVPKLASKCGTRYMKIVQACLDAPETLQDKPHHVEAAECLLELVEELAKCCALDDAGAPAYLDIEIFESMLEQQIDVSRPSKSNATTTSSNINPAPIPQPLPTPKKKISTSSKSKQKSPEALRKWPDMDIPQEHLETWNNMLMPRLSKMLKSALKDSMESCSVSLMMIGSTPEKAKTTICVQCHDTARIRETLCNRFKPKSGWGLVVCAGDVRRSGQIPRKHNKRGSNARRSGADSDYFDKSGEKSREQLYQPWPGCGASIGAWTNEQHLPPVSFGGTVVVDGQPYGMTVHHMLDDPDDIERDNIRAGPQAPRRSTAPRSTAQTADLETETRFMGSEDDLPEALDELKLYDEDELADTSDEEDASDAESDASTIRPDYSVMDENGDEFFFLDDDEEDDDEAPDLEDDEEGHSSEESEDEETGSIGDTPSIQADRYDDEDFCITQPAWDDVPENFFSDDPEYRDEEHLLSHSFGLVHASSGLKRIEKNNIKHEVDWALIRIKDSRLNLTCNPEAAAMAGLPSRNPPQSSKSKRRKKSMQGSIFAEPALTAVTPLSSLPKLHVSSTGRSSGRTTGRISQAMSLLKLPGRASFSYSFTVEGGMGVPGDSGAWVYCEERRELCGHILAWSDSFRCAYIAPMEIIFEDLKQRLGATEVRLPSERSTGVSVVPAPEKKSANTSIVEENLKGKPSSEADKESRSELTRQIQAQKQQSRIDAVSQDTFPAQQAQLASTLASLKLNTDVPTMSSRAQVYSRPSSKASQREDSSPISASSARRSRAGLQRPLSPGIVQARKTPTPPPRGSPRLECAPGTKKDFDYICTNEKCAGPPAAGLVSRAIPS